MIYMHMLGGTSNFDATCGLSILEVISHLEETRAVGLEHKMTQ